MPRMLAGSRLRDASGSNARSPASRAGTRVDRRGRVLRPGSVIRICRPRSAPPGARAEGRWPLPPRECQLGADGHRHEPAERALDAAVGLDGRRVHRLGRIVSCRNAQRRPIRAGDRRVAQCFARSERAGRSNRAGGPAVDASWTDSVQKRAIPGGRSGATFPLAFLGCGLNSTSRPARRGRGLLQP